MEGGRLLRVTLREEQPLLVVIFYLFFLLSELLGEGVAEFVNRSVEVNALFASKEINPECVKRCFSNLPQFFDGEYDMNFCILVDELLYTVE